MNKVLGLVGVIVLLFVSGLLDAAEPADRDLIPEARAVLNYEDTYQKAFDIMRQVTPNKMLALCEGEAIPNPDLMAGAGPKWLYCLPWWGPGKNHPADWIKTTYQHDFVITRDELPNWTSAAPRR